MYHHKTAQEVLQELSSDQTRGLGREEAEKRREQYGENRLQEKKKKSTFQRFLDQFKDVMILILLLAAAVSFFVACTEGEEFFEPLLILLIVWLVRRLRGQGVQNDAGQAQQTKEPTFKGPVYTVDYEEVDEDKP